MNQALESALSWNIVKRLRDGIDMTSERNKSTREQEADRDNTSGDEFDATSSAYELEPFLLPGERITQNKIPAIRHGQTLQELSAYESQDSIYELDPIVIPPEQALQPQPQVQEEGATEVHQGQPASSDRFMEADEHTIPPGQYQMLKEYEKRTRQLKSQERLDPLIGASIGGRYGIFELIGRGNMASIYKARQYSTGAIVACKTFREDADDTVIARFEREIAIHSLLNHENIVSFVDTVEDEHGRLFLIMELMRGISLQEVLELHGPIEQTENIWSILRQVCDALEYAHDLGVIHRDLKTGNIVLSKKENEEIVVKILDFGISKYEGNETQKLTRDGRAVGSPHYMSPEQCHGGDLIPSSDLYSLGTAVYEMITGKPPYYGLPMLEVMQAHCNPDLVPEPLSARVPDIPAVKQLETILFKMLEADPDKRISSAAQLRKCLDFWISIVRSEQLDQPIPEGLLISRPVEFKPAAEPARSVLQRHPAREKRHAARVSMEARPVRERQPEPAEVKPDAVPEPVQPGEAPASINATDRALFKLVAMVVVVTTIAVSAIGYLVYMLALR